MRAPEHGNEKKRAPTELRNKLKKRTITSGHQSQPYQSNQLPYDHIDNHNHGTVLWGLRNLGTHSRDKSWDRHKRKTHIVGNVAKFSDKGGIGVRTSVHREDCISYTLLTEIYRLEDKHPRIHPLLVLGSWTVTWTFNPQPPATRGPPSV